MSLPDGEHIPIEERDAGEVTCLWYKEPMAPEGIKVYNPAFDITDHNLVSAIVTEKGVVRPPYGEGLRRVQGPR
jgi:methylthioribose-1-phosphate isomerase